MDISIQKTKFLDKYNPRRDVEIALSNSVKAAVQHNSLYSSETSSSKRKEIRDFWFRNLLKIGKQFEENLSISSYEESVVNFKNLMNREYSREFSSGSTHGSEFRISHSQKSISVFVKYLWCMDLIGEPNICPVDRIILSQTEAKNFKDVSWGFVNDIETHRKKFQYIVNSASVAGTSVAKWELLLFGNYKE